MIQKIPQRFLDLFHVVNNEIKQKILQVYLQNTHANNRKHNPEVGINPFRILNEIEYFFMLYVGSHEDNLPERSTVILSVEKIGMRHFYVSFEVEIHRGKRERERD